MKMAPDGITPEDEGAMFARVEAFNARPLPEREAVIGKSPSDRPERKRKR